MKISSLETRHLPTVVAALAVVPGVRQRDADSLPALERYLLRNPNLSVIAYMGRSLAGFVLSGHDGRRGYLNHLIVLPEFRRRGVATRLVESALDRLHKAGISKAHVDVLEENDVAQAFWSQAGWQQRDDIHRFSVVISGGVNA
ncbi:MAG: family N-acetyltransferase [Hydrocarboniphaga sp.]|uniref:GNAT family N-acetyltransferase n=1 Tax=Hydrocarboniphaga sp. TaxID=2033016 RepID=UPI002632F3D1|nr:GNAT family N-acetyltransferase [Hydrocarboniphaga sp.]MDB5969286.1 family N-acetyltransferase [Hydrocarboniphaga sp.]